MIGDGGGIDYRDIMAGVDLCIAEGTANPDRLGISGLSYGGLHGGMGGGPDGSLRCRGRDVRRLELVSFHLTSEVWWYRRRS